MWEQELGELSTIKLTWMCLMKKNKEQPGGHWQDWIHARCLTNRPSERGLTWAQVRKGGCSGPGNRKQLYCQPANIRKLLDLSGLYPFPLPALSKATAKGLNYLVSSG